MPEPIRCTRCGRSFNATFRRCPFCNALVEGPAAVAGAPGPGLRRDYAAHAEQFISAQRAFVALDFHPAAVAVLDVFFDLTWGTAGLSPGSGDWRPSAGQGASIAGLGSFFGELVRRELGGTWREDSAAPDNLLQVSVDLPGGVQLFPMGHAFKRMKDGEAHRFEPLYAVVRERHGVKATGAEVEGWVRHARNFESLDRYDLAGTFYGRAARLEPNPARKAELQKLEAGAAGRARSNEPEGPDAEAESRDVSEARDELAGLLERARRELDARGVRTAGAATLLGLDIFVDERLGSGTQNKASNEDAADLERALGAYVGERLCTRWKGRWREASGLGLARWQVEWPSGFAISPFEIVSRRVKEGVSILEQVATLLEPLCASGESEDPAEIPGDWFDQADDYASKGGRLDLAVRFATLGLGSGGDHASVRVKLARWCRGLGKIADAGRHLDEALRLDARSAEVWLERARLALARGDAQEAETDADAAQVLFPEGWSIEASLVRAAALAAQSRNDAALLEFERVLHLHPSHVEALLGLARALIALHRAPEARVWLHCLTDRAESEPERTFLAAIAAEKERDVVEAHDLFARAKEFPALKAGNREYVEKRLTALSRDPAVLVAAAERLEAVGQAVDAYARINAAHPTLAEPWRERGVGLSMLGRTEEALQCLDRAVALEPAEAKSYDHKAVILARVGRVEEALAVLEQGLQGSERSALLLMRRGVFLTTAGRTEEAMRMFEDALCADPAYAEVWAFKGDLEARIGDTVRAVASLKEYLRRRSGSREKRVEIARRQLWALQNPGRELDRDKAQRCQSAALERGRAGDLPGALQLLDEALVADPLWGEPWLNRGTRLLQLSRFEESLDAYRAAADLLGVTRLVAQGLSACLTKLGHHAEALEWIDRLLATSANDVEALRAKARILVRLGRRAEAAALYQQLVARCPADATLAAERVAFLQASPS
jgi:tetratricopeptide (TPR) repeat protein